VIRIASAGLWLGVGLAKMAALVWLIDEKWQLALLALLAAWSLAAAALWLRSRRRQTEPPT
jgi:membrane protein implicated in regulation of membrane protease activity